MSPGAASGHILQSGYAFFLNGCDTGSRSFMRRAFVINIGPSAPNIDQHGLTGSWYQAVTSGQGQEIEVFPDHVAPGTGYLQGGWFTFDNEASGAADHNRWYTFGGNVRAGDSAAVLSLYQNVAGNFNAPPITYAVNGKQYIAIASGLCCAGPGAAPARNTRGALAGFPELRLQGNATMVFVFGL